MMDQYRVQAAEQVDRRAPWQTPTFRRLVTKDAEGNGSYHDEGNGANNGQCGVPEPGLLHSCKNIR